MKNKILLGLALLLFSNSLPAEVKVAKIFSSDMILQRDKAVTVWGTAADGEEIRVSINGQSLKTKARDGKWKVTLKPLKAGGPFDLKISGTNKLVFTNVLVGDIWLCGGQSNMAWDIRDFTKRDNEISRQYKEIVTKSADNKNLRLIVMKEFSAYPGSNEIPVKDNKTFQGKWQEPSETLSPHMSAVGFVFAWQLQKHLKVPIGLIDANRGATAIEYWEPQSSLKTQGLPLKQRNGYNGMIACYKDFPIKGFIWYQGEANAYTVENCLAYEKKFKLMIEGWRQDFNDPQMPFIFAQLAGYEKNYFVQRLTYPLIRDSQKAALSLANTGMAGAVDLGASGNIHPPYKIPLSHRFFLAARKLGYGEDIVYSGPTYKSLKISGAKVQVTFEHCGSGLTAKAMTLEGRKLTADKLEGFQLCGADRVFHDAHARIKENTVLLESAKVKKPVAVRYAYFGFPFANLYNREGLPATPFRTDSFEVKIDQQKAVLYSRYLYLPKTYRKMDMNIEEKAKVAAIHDQIMSKEIVNEVRRLKSVRNDIYSDKGSKAPEAVAANEQYYAYLTPLLEKVGTAIKAARIFK
ncbi:MAG: sialate O-acetylesterase [Lentisphaerales bacterium]|nr:sialate O-acetylesterase [Lentisphaerales bacterium]